MHADKNTVKRLDRWLEDEMTSKEIQLQSGRRRGIDAQRLEKVESEKKVYGRVRAMLNQIHREEWNR